MLFVTTAVSAWQRSCWIFLQDTSGRGYLVLVSSVVLLRGGPRRSMEKEPTQGGKVGREEVNSGLQGRGARVLCCCCVLVLRALRFELR